MKYRFKDRALQEKLDAITDNRFSKSVEKSADHISLRNDYCEDFVLFGIGVIRIRLYGQAFEEIPEYDPAAWNEWPSVEPPPNTLLRIEVVTEQIGKGTPEPSGGKVRCRGCATYERGFWMLGEKIIVRPKETVRFRPWDDCDEEDSK